jgi:hypothetical protein
MTHVIASRDPEKEMNVSKLVGIPALFLCSAGAVPAQNLVAPGELAERSAFTRPSLDPSVDSLRVMPKSNIAYVETTHEKHIRIVWLASIVAMAGGTAADAASSWNKRESNTLLASSNGTFGGKGVAIKTGIAAGVLLPQLIFRKHRDWHTAFAIGNFAEAGIFAGATVHNLNVK